MSLGTVSVLLLREEHDGGVCRPHYALPDKGFIIRREGDDLTPDSRAGGVTRRAQSRTFVAARAPPKRPRVPGTVPWFQHVHLWGGGIRPRFGIGEQAASKGAWLQSISAKLFNRDNPSKRSIPVLVAVKVPVYRKGHAPTPTRIPNEATPRTR
jgi:hypothetical protein